MNKYEIKPYSLCILCKISRKHLNNVLESNKEASCYTLFQIATFMEISITDLIEK